ncbi:MAG: hypothetical protein QXU69_04720 [Thermofilaceae archaeon]
MATWRDVGRLYGGQHIGKGILRALREVDRAVGREAAAVHERPSTWITIVGSILLPSVAVLGKLRKPWDEVLAIVGGYISTALWDIAEEAMMGAGGGATIVAAPAIAQAPATATAAPAAPAPKVEQGAFVLT